MIDLSIYTQDPASMPNNPDVVNPLPAKMGIIYRIQTAGTGLPVHTHTDSNIHITIVLKGSVSVVKGQQAAVIYEQGSVIDFEVNESHSIIAVEPNTWIYNIQKVNGSLLADVNDIKVDLEKLSQTITNMNSITGP